MAGNGSKLADIILEEKRGCRKDCLFTGVIRKDIIPVKLKQEGVDLEEVVIYKTEPKAGILDNFVSCCEGRLDLASVFSPQGTEEIVEHIQKGKILLDGVRIASIGPTTLEYLNGRGIESHAMAPKPTAAAL